MEPSPRVSIIIPAYNAALTVDFAIGSLLRQDERDIEVVVVDDASRDSTVKVTEALAARDNRVRLLQCHVNCGPAAARNLGIDRAKGQWIAMLDADDAFAPDRISRLLSIAEHNRADVVSDNPLLCSSRADANGVPMLSPSILPQGRWMSATEFVAGNVGSRFRPRVSYGFMKPVIRRSFLDRHALRYDERNRFGEDYLFSLMCLVNGARWWIVPDALYSYAISDGTLTDRKSAGDLLRICAKEQELLQLPWLMAREPGLTDALRRHKNITEHFYYYRAFVEALKSRELPRAAGTLFENHHGFCHIMAESTLQAPRVAVKALRGGFRQSRNGTDRRAATGSD